jgi:hypothetical protein
LRRSLCGLGRILLRERRRGQEAEPARQQQHFHAQFRPHRSRLIAWIRLSLSRAAQTGHARRFDQIQADAR